MGAKTYPDEQVIHDEKQVRSPEELQVGKTYHYMSDNPDSSTRILRVVSLDRIGEGFVGVRELRPDDVSFIHQRGEEISVRDAGLKPYAKPEGKWNPHHWLIPEGN